ncbi:MAG: transposase [Microcystis aeruginosa L211-07]|uniref:Transposase n=1 Tax=Microcystis aeruginosa Ma_MB_F_20061100_S20D TaxID=2486253 RepID=A0A552EWM3_MICAE|nr:transposase [Microcystis aeruginosa L211-07]TRU37783.1 MAG: transposase [Microcystis aeruginosa Ma_MB_F_20061100_S20]TRU38872.1 MAG: transposase [Microcystis aeruginosa Ma_MB_F_20061100_S20D]
MVKAFLRTIVNRPLVKIKNLPLVEGIKNKLKLIKLRGYGLRNFQNFWVRSMLSWHLVC